MQKFKIEPNTKVQRKIDYFITPYNQKINVERGMKFADNSSISEQKTQNDDKYDWNKLTDVIMNSNDQTMKYLIRNRVFSGNLSGDFLTKLDLIESHPKLFENEKIMEKFKKEELELLRVLMNNNKPK